MVCREGSKESWNLFPVSCDITNCHDNRFICDVVHGNQGREEYQVSSTRQSHCQSTYSPEEV